MEKLNTHYYDGKLNAQINIENYDEHMFNSLYKRIKNPLALRMLDLMKRDMNGNRDTCNNINAMNILMSIIKLNPSNEYISILEEQLADTLISGSCPQGRTTRLWQIYISIK